MRAAGKGGGRIGQRPLAVEEPGLDAQRCQLFASRLAAAGAGDSPPLALQHPGERQSAIAEAEAEQGGLA